jgi:hypothetical protein
MRREAHFDELGFSCACRSCFVSRRVERVTNRLMGRKKQTEWSTPPQLPRMLNIPEWKKLVSMQRQHDDLIDTISYMFGFNVTAPTVALCSRT